MSTVLDCAELRVLAPRAIPVDALECSESTERLLLEACYVVPKFCESKTCADILWEASDISEREDLARSFCQFGSKRDVMDNED